MVGTAGFREAGAARCLLVPLFLPHPHWKDTRVVLDGKPELTSSPKILGMVTRQRCRRSSVRSRCLDKVVCSKQKSKSLVGIEPDDSEFMKYFLPYRRKRTDDKHGWFEGVASIKEAMAGS